VDEAIGRLETFEERLKYKNERPVNTQEGVGSENLDGGVTESMSRPGIKEDIYAARTPIGRQSVGSITNQKHDQSGFMIDHNNSKGGNPVVRGQHSVTMYFDNILHMYEVVDSRSEIEIGGGLAYAGNGTGCLFCICVF
ncbi:hypothetical protein Tco_1170034, partial [Tanacetum coccineum]